jgi:amidase
MGPVPNGAAPREPRVVPGLGVSLCFPPVPDDLADLDAIAQADLVRRGEASPLELVDAAIARIEKLDPTLNAVIHPRFDRAREEAASPALPEGPFRGVPILVKDLWCHTAGDPFHKGMRFLKELRWREPHDTEHAARLRRAGFVIVGRTNTPELGLAPTTEPEAYGPTRNPWDPARSPGGSSGGSATAVASRMVPVAQASDGGGSIRIPASACGVVGLKPSRGRVTCGPFAGEYTAGLSVELCVSRTVRDTAAYLDAVAGPGVGDPSVAPPPPRPYAREVGADPGRLRVGLLDRDPRGQVEVDPEVARATREAARLLEAAGCVVEESHPAALGDPELAMGIVTLFAVGVAAALEHWSERTGRAIGPGDVEEATWALAEAGRTVTAAQLWLARERMLVAARRVAAWWADGFDLLLPPTLPALPPALGHFTTPSDPARGLARMTPFTTFTAAFNATGQPAISLPLAQSNGGLPIGVQLVAAFGREDLLLRVAARLEEARPWADRRPPIAA